VKELNEHWNEIFRKTDDCGLGWYEKDFSQSLKFLNLIPNWRESKMFVAGAGTSGLIELLLRSEAELILNDLSQEAIIKAKDKYGDNRRTQWLCHDISKPLPAWVNDIDIWFDRAVLHFLVNEGDVEGYFDNVHAAVKPGRYAIFAEFSKTGATRCAGLEVRRYDTQDLSDRLVGFELLTHEEYTYVNPNGDPRPYIYTLFKKAENREGA
jgi:EEF1A lysine methyltransferase 2